MGQAAAGETQTGTGASGHRGWSIYQMMNPYDNDVDQILKDNPFAPYVLPMVIALLVAGFAEHFLYHYLQRRTPMAGLFASGGGAA